CTAVPLRGGGRREEPGTGSTTSGGVRIARIAVPSGFRESSIESSGHAGHSAGHCLRRCDSNHWAVHNARRKIRETKISEPDRPAALCLAVVSSQAPENAALVEDLAAGFIVP